MIKLTLLFATLSSAAVCAAFAQELYKSVGPDGKVTFSDRPLNVDKSKVSVMRANVLRPIEVAPPPTILAPTPKRATPQVAIAPLADELEQALLGVMLAAETTSKLEPICGQNPLLAKEYNIAANAWRQRNATFLDQQKRILAESVAPTKRAQMQTVVSGKTDTAFGEVSALSAAGRVKWCRQAIFDMASGAKDVANNAELALPLITSKRK